MKLSPDSGKAMSTWIGPGDTLLLPGTSGREDWYVAWGHWYLNGYLPTLVFSAAIRWEVLDQAWKVLQGKLSLKEKYDGTWNNTTAFDLRWNARSLTGNSERLNKIAMVWVHEARRVIFRNISGMKWSYKIKMYNLAMAEPTDETEHELTKQVHIEVIRFPSLVHSSIVNKVLYKNPSFRLGYDKKTQLKPLAFYDAPIVMTGIDQTPPFSLNVLSLSTKKMIPKTTGVMKLEAVSQENKARMLFLGKNAKQALGTMDAARIDAVMAEKQ